MVKYFEHIITMLLMIILENVSNIFDTWKFYFLNIKKLKILTKIVFK